MEASRNRDSPKLQFSKEESARLVLEKKKAKVEKAAKQLEHAERKIRKQRRLVLTQEEMIAENQASPISAPASSEKASAKKKTVRLHFEEHPTQPPSQTQHPARQTLRAAHDALHQQVSEANEDDNAAVHAVLKADDIQESVLRAGEHAYHAHALRPYKQAAASERKLERAQTQYQKTRQRVKNPSFTSNPFSRWHQKRAIRKAYAAEKSARNAASRTEQITTTAGNTAKKLSGYFTRHPTALAMIALAAMLLLVMSSLQSCTPLAQSVLQSVIIGTYPAEEEDVKAAERAYAALEKQLADEMMHYDRDHPEYDEVLVDADEIWHDPYVLIAIISAVYDGQPWTLDTAMPVIEKYFQLQYVVTPSVTTETRYRTETKRQMNPKTGKMETVTVRVPYRYKTCHVRLENKDLSHLPVVSMSHHTMGMYALYMATHGNMEGIFASNPYARPLKDPMLYDIPEETLNADPTFAALMEEAKKYIGYPYVWGGALPETSFDCSGFVSYVFTHSGVYNTGRLGAKGLRSLCEKVPNDQAKPGDVVFFEGTMGDDVSGITHCGLYVGNGMMIHCGSPIGFADLNDAYWRQHFHSFGRMPGL